jgi:ABC-type lipoprotein export system ATPase subunit
MVLQTIIQYVKNNIIWYFNYINMDKIIQYLNNSNKPIYVTGKSGSGKTTMLKKLPFSVKFISIQDIFPTKIYQPK